jgi:hypothetical protein
MILTIVNKCIAIPVLLYDDWLRNEIMKLLKPSVIT